jgi:hypothetical protein
MWTATCAVFGNVFQGLWIYCLSMFFCKREMIILYLVQVSTSHFCTYVLVNSLKMKRTEYYNTNVIIKWENTDLNRCRHKAVAFALSGTVFLERQTVPSRNKYQDLWVLASVLKIILDLLRTVFCTTMNGQLGWGGYRIQVVARVNIGCLTESCSPHPALAPQGDEAAC